MLKRALAVCAAGALFCGHTALAQDRDDRAKTGLCLTYGTLAQRFPYLQTQSLQFRWEPDRKQLIIQGPSDALRAIGNWTDEIKGTAPASDYADRVILGDPRHKKYWASPRGQWDLALNASVQHDVELARFNTFVRRALNEYYLATFSINSARSTVSKILARNHCDAAPLEAYSVEEIVTGLPLGLDEADARDVSEILNSQFFFKDNFFEKDIRNDPPNILAKLAALSALLYQSKKHAAAFQSMVAEAIAIESAKWVDIDFEGRCSLTIAAAEGVCAGVVTPESVTAVRLAQQQSSVDPRIAYQGGFALKEIGKSLKGASVWAITTVWDIWTKIYELYIEAQNVDIANQTKYDNAAEKYRATLHEYYNLERKADARITAQWDIFTSPASVSNGGWSMDAQKRLAELEIPLASMRMELRNLAEDAKKQYDRLQRERDKDPSLPKPQEPPRPAGADHKAPDDSKSTGWEIAPRDYYTDVNEAQYYARGAWPRELAVLEENVRQCFRTTTGCNFAEAEKEFTYGLPGDMRGWVDYCPGDWRQDRIHELSDTLRRKERQLINIIGRLDCVQDNYAPCAAFSARVTRELFEYGSEEVDAIKKLLAGPKQLVSDPELDFLLRLPGPDTDAAKQSTPTVEELFTCRSPKSRKDPITQALGPPKDQKGDNPLPAIPTATPADTPTERDSCDKAILSMRNAPPVTPQQQDAYHRTFKLLVRPDVFAP